MKYLKYYLCFLLVLEGGVIASILTKMVWGVPEHYNGNWWGLSLGIAITIITSWIIIET